VASHYSYRVDHDLGFAPHIKEGICTVCGCKKTTVERWAKTGSWVVGIGGNGTGKPNTLIYAMQVAETPSYREFKKAHPALSSYLTDHNILPDAPVLISKYFFYFGDHAPPLPAKLSHIAHPTQGCKRLTDTDIELLNKLLLTGLAPGLHGKPNNGLSEWECVTC
jgi:hypothetical protein